MSSFKLTQKAKSDLKSIASYTQRKWGKEQRNTYICQFDETFHKLAAKPKIGTSCDFIKNDYLKFPCVSHIIYYYQVSQSEILIVRILHKRMDPKPKL